MFSTIRRRMSSLTNYSTAATSPKSEGVFGFRFIREPNEILPVDVHELMRIIKNASTFDLNRTSSLLAEYITSSGSNFEELSELPSEDLFELMHILQRAVDARVKESELFQQCLKRLAEQKSAIPSHLFLSGIRRLDKDPIAGGGFADVWRGEFRGEIVALKVLRDFDWAARESSAKIPKEFCKEALIWSKFDDRNVLPFYGVCLDEFAPRYALVSPWMGNGNMPAFLRCYPDVDRVSLIARITLGLRYLHRLQPPIVHGDLRGANVLIDEEGRPRLADFGLARAVDSQATLVSSFKGKGHIRWQAPELLNVNRFPGLKGEVTTMSDIYALACVYLEAFSGEMPFANIRNDGALLIEVAINDQRPARPGISATQRGINDSMWALMQECWATQPADRPVIEIMPKRLLQVYPPPQFHYRQAVTGVLFNAISTEISQKSIDAFKILRHASDSDDHEDPMSTKSAFHQSLFQKCSRIRMRLLQVPGFDAYFSICAQIYDAVHVLDDPITELWDCFALGAPLCFLYNLLPDVEPIIKTNTDPDSIEPLDIKSVKSAIARFVMAINKTDITDSNDLLLITDLLDRSTPDGFLTVLKWVARLLDRLALQLKVPNSISDTQQENMEDMTHKFIESELSYIRSLELMLEFARAATSINSLDPDSAHVMFPNLSRLIDFHVSLFETFSACAEDPLPKQRWGLCFTEHEEEFTIYESYYANHDQAIAYARKAKRKLSKKETQKDEVIFDLEEYLMKPIKRIYEYSQFLVILMWSRSGSEYLNSSEIFAALQLLRRILKHAHLIHTARKLQFQINNWGDYQLNSFGRLFCDDVFFVTTSAEECRVLLFEHTILICSVANELSDRYHKLSKDPNIPLQLVKYLPTSTLHAVYRSCDDYVYSLHLNFVIGQEQEFQYVTICCQSQARHIQWWKELSRLIGNLTQISEYDNIFMYS